MPETSDRFALPFLIAGQAQKEVIHNEALALIDILLNPVVQSVAPGSIPSNPGLGQCWIVGTSPGGAWTGQAGAIAAWTAGGWRFVTPRDGMTLWSLADSRSVQRRGTVWVIGVLVAQSLSISGNQVVGARQGAIAAPTGGTVIDTESRTTITAILNILRAHGLIAT
jgi:hypothetical protein